MENVLYRGRIIDPRDSSDGETPTEIIVTKEVNGIALWRESAEEGIVCLKHEMFVRPERYIEEAVDLARKERSMLEKH